jgi:hypothetical protein
MPVEGLAEHLRTEFQQLAADSRTRAKATLTSNSIATGPPVAPHEYAAVVAATNDEALNKRDVFGDGDQSFLTHRGPQDAKTQALKNMWVAGGDFLTLARVGRLSPFMLNCLDGKHEMVAKSLAKATEEGGQAMSQLLAKRETLMRFTPLDGAIYGALQIGKTQGGSHVKVAKLLLNAGSNPDTKDICGSTPLMRCTTCATTELLLDIGLLLIEHGADANMKNRFGETALMETVNSNRPDCAMLLCEGGADPMIARCNNPEQCPFQNRLLGLPAWGQVCQELFVERSLRADAVW